MVSFTRGNSDVIMRCSPKNVTQVTVYRAANLADIEVPHYHGRSHQILVDYRRRLEGGRINATVRARGRDLMNPSPLHLTY